MKIINVTPGILPIPPNGWGAVEKIIWEYHQNFLNKGHSSEILYLNDINYKKCDVVHIHVANLALEAHSRKIPYYFTCHDHHAYLYGKDSHCFKENYNAIKHSIKSFVPAKYLVEYFDLPNLYYLSHGVNNDFFKFNNQFANSHKLLCVANNGFIHDRSEDRKGFGFAIEAAKQLNLPITIAGPKNNKSFFDKNNFEYDKLNIVYDLNENDLLSLYQSHTIFLHPSMLEAGHPNLTLLEAISCGLPVIGTFEENNNLPGLIKTPRIVNNIVQSLLDVMKNYDFYKKECQLTKIEKSWQNITDKLLNFYKTNSMKDQLINIYNEIEVKHKECVEEINKLNVSFIDGPKVEILGDNLEKYKVTFIDNTTKNVVYETDIDNNMWCMSSLKYFIDWQIQIQESKTENTLNFNLTLNSKKVCIINESPSLGDFLAWMPFVDLFQKKHNCILDFYTPHKNLVENNYQNINFLNYKSNPTGYYAVYKLGYFNSLDRDRSPTDPRTITLQQIASDILGLEYFEIKPKLTKPNVLKNKCNKKYVCIGSLSTAQAKLWNNENGWIRVVEYLKELGYDVVSIDKHNNIGNSIYKNIIPYNSIDKTGDLPLEERINDLYFCDFFIGLGSGLSWLAWALNKPVIMISGFSDPISEFNTQYRVHTKEVCNSCWNDTSFKFDSSKWDWCPRNKDFECSTKITFEMVKEKIDKCISDNF